jgi:hypothetical protein
MNNDLWDIDRIRNIGSIMERYSKHLEEGHRIRLGIDGDPCNIYRNASDAPVGTVVSIHKPENEEGMVRFSLRMDSDDTLIELDNRNVDPSKIWEIDPMYLDEFNDSMLKNQDKHNKESIERESINEQYRGQTEARLADLTDQLSRIEDINADFRATTASTLRYIAADLLRLSQGEQVEFSQEYADRYDLAVSKNEDFRGELQKKREEAISRNDRHDYDISNLEVLNPPSLSYDDLESDVLTDE